MTREEWFASDDPLAILEALRADWRGEEADLVRLIHRYLLACCRAIWTLLPMEASREGVEVAERYIEGRATREEFHRAEWNAEGAAFFLDPFEWEREEEDPEVRQARMRYEADRKARIEPLAREVEAIPPEELCRLVRPTAKDSDNSPRQLLADAAYFADTAMCYPGIRPREGLLEKHKKFLFVTVLREVVDNYFQWSGKELKTSRKPKCLQRLILQPFSRGTRPKCLHADLGRNLKNHRLFSPLPDH